MKQLSLYALLFCYVIILWTSFVYYPRWQQPQAEATIGWDVSGYYYYLPAFLIYGDPVALTFKDSIQEKYHSTPFFAQAFRHPENGRYIFKYSAGMAIMYMPYFLLAHVLAPSLGFPADGFSPPYQLAVQVGSVLWCFLGLWFLRRILLEYFQDKTVALLLLLYALGTNYLNFAAVDSAMTHNWLFTWYAILMVLSQRFYQSPSLQRAASIGFTCGICALIRPTDIISVIIPALWGVSSWRGLTERYAFLVKNLSYYALAAVVTASVGFIQLAYWKYASGHWLVYSYEDQGFSWLHPHVKDYVFSYRCGWLVYTPMMVFAILGCIPLVRQRIQVWPVVLFSLINLYIVTAWDIWWYGGRAMVQSYAVWAFPFAAFLETLDKAAWRKWVVYPLFALFVYYNIWWTHQAHRGGLIDPYNMTRAYFWAVVGRYEVDPETIKLYDTSELFRGKRQHVRSIFETNFEQDSVLANNPYPAISGSFSEYLNTEKQNTAQWRVALTPGASTWLRASALIHVREKEWDNWRMTQFIVRFMDGDQKVKEKLIRVQRLMNQGETKTIYIDVRLPEKKFDSVLVYFWHAESSKPILIDDVKMELFNP